MVLLMVLLYYCLFRKETLICLPDFKFPICICTTVCPITPWEKLLEFLDLLDDYFAFHFQNNCIKI